MDYDEFWSEDQEMQYYEWNEHQDPYADDAFEDYEEIQLPFYHYIITDVESRMSYLYHHGYTWQQWIEYEILDKAPHIWTNDQYKGWMYPYTPPAA